MNSITRIIALAFFVALAMSATTGTFSTVTSFAASSTSARLYTQGYLVTLTAAGWAYGDTISLTAASATSVTYATLVSHTGLTGVGLAVVGATTGCTTAPTVTTTGYTTASLIGNGAINCASDFVTLYTATPGGSTTTNTNFAFATIPLVDTTAFKWTITNPASVVAANCDGVTVQPVGGTAVTVASTTCATAAPGVISQAVSTSSFAFYVQTATAASVCFQTETQYGASPANCGTLVVTSSAGILSATISGFVAMVALIFFN